MLENKRQHALRSWGDFQLKESVVDIEIGRRGGQEGRGEKKGIAGDQSQGAGRVISSGWKRAMNQYRGANTSLGERKREQRRMGGCGERGGK